jgi:hypothetical protein
MIMISEAAVHFLSGGVPDEQLRVLALDRDLLRHERSADCRVDVLGHRTRNELSDCARLPPTDDFHRVEFGHESDFMMFWSALSIVMLFLDTDPVKKRHRISCCSLVSVLAAAWGDPAAEPILAEQTRPRYRENNKDIRDKTGTIRTTRWSRILVGSILLVLSGESPFGYLAKCTLLNSLSSISCLYQFFDLNSLLSGDRDSDSSNRRATGFSGLMILFVQCQVSREPQVRHEWLLGCNSSDGRKCHLLCQSVTNHVTLSERNLRTKGRFICGRTNSGGTRISLFLLGSALHHGLKLDKPSQQLSVVLDERPSLLIGSGTNSECLPVVCVFPIAPESKIRVTEW